MTRSQHIKCLTTQCIPKEMHHILLQSENKTVGLREQPFNITWNVRSGSSNQVILIPDFILSIPYVRGGGWGEGQKWG